MATRQMRCLRRQASLNSVVSILSRIVNTMTWIKIQEQNHPDALPHPGGFGSWPLKGIAVASSMRSLQSGVPLIG
ncbi:MAG: hypothetical protein ACYC4S_05730 [Rhodoferax sp.]